jgi:hypothetical protein
MRRATTRLKHRSIDLKRGHAKVCNLYIELIIKQQILRFQVAMTDQVAMAKVKRRYYLFKELSRFFDS